jgi:hypothetical protein
MMMMAATLHSKGQDIIHKIDTTTIRTKIIEVGINEIKFKKYDNIINPRVSFNLNLGFCH